MNNKILLALGVALVFNSCRKEDTTAQSSQTAGKEKDLVYPVSQLDSLSDINKTTSWYNTNKSFNELFDVQQSLYWGFEVTQSGLVPYNRNTTGTWSASKEYYWNDLGTYLYTDLTGDGKKDLYAYYWKNPWPTNAKGLNLFSEYVRQPQKYNLQTGLTQVRKCVLADVNNDKFSEIVLFSSGYDGMPFPGDSIGIFYPRQLRYQHLTKDIGYFHGGATGDINNDGRVDIIGYSGGSAQIPVHPAAYINNGNDEFILTNSIFKNFEGSNFYTVELFDLNKDGKLDLLLGSRGTFIVVLQENGIYNRQNAISVPLESSLEPMDIAFLDFNRDGIPDLLCMSNKDGYNGYGIRLFLYGNNKYTDATADYFDIHTDTGTNNWIKWIRLFDKDYDGDIDIVGDGFFGDLTKVRIFWQNENGKFVREVHNR